MYKCEECGCVFEEPKEYQEHHPYGMGYVAESFYCCPSCNGSIGEAQPCKFCEEYGFEDELQDGICEKCISELKKRFDVALHNNFTEEEIKTLIDVYGEWII